MKRRRSHDYLQVERDRVSQSFHVNPVRIRALWLVPDGDVPADEQLLLPRTPALDLPFALESFSLELYCSA
jgi:hypothetical protein